MIEKTSESTKLAILRKTPFAHSTRPSDDGMPAEQVKKMFYTALADEDNSVLAEMERMRKEANISLDAKMDADKLCDTIEGNLDSHHVPSTLAVSRYVDRVGNAYRLYYSDIVVRSDDWYPLDTPIASYGYAADVEVYEARSTMMPDVFFAPEDSVRPQLATFCHCLDGVVRIYSTEALDQAVTIEGMVLTVPTYFSLMLDAPHANVMVLDEHDKEYHHGDFVAVGANLRISLSPETGYRLISYKVNGVTYLPNDVAQITVAGTVRVASAEEQV